MPGVILPGCPPDQTMCGFKADGQCPNRAAWHSVVTMADLDPYTAYVLDFDAEDVHFLGSCDEHIEYVHTRWTHYVTHAFDLPCAYPGGLWDDDGCYLPEPDPVSASVARGEPMTAGTPDYERL